MRKKKQRQQKPAVPMGTGSHLHAIFRTWFHQDFSPSCSCRETVKDMDSNPPSWSLEHIEEIAGKIRTELQQRGWLGKLANKLPVGRPVKGLIRLAVKLAEADIARGIEDKNAEVSRKLAESLKEISNG
jgi:hypothetical protein